MIIEKIMSIYIAHCDILTYTAGKCLYIRTYVCVWVCGTIMLMGGPSSLFTREKYPSNSTIKGQASLERKWNQGRSLDRKEEKKHSSICY